MIEAKIRELKKAGFEFAFDFDLINHRKLKFIFYRYGDYLVVPYPELNSLENIPEKEIFKKKIICTRIETEEQFLKAMKAGVDLFSGYYISKPEPIRGEINFTALASTIMRVLERIEKEADLEEIEELIKSDPGLVAKLLKFVNSSYFYLPMEIKSVRQAITYLGIRNLKRYLLLLLVMDLASTLKIPVNVYKKMLLSALIAEQLAQKVGMDKEEAFLGGLFYCSDLVLKVPPEKIAVDLRLASEILEGYLGDNEKLHCIFEIAKIIAFELERKEEFSNCLKMLGLDEKTLSEIVDKAKEHVDLLII
jgi:EAL and modified HD-GYP domain-containing signal transduction protein